ncbi:MAG: hypothetical protein J6Q15_01480 [Clostridia bacterium]|nr:hypothetical protein [Clostridia bacterium]
MKDQIILLGKSEIALIAGNSSRDVVAVNIIDNELNFAVYKNSSAKRVATNRSFAVKNNKPVRMINFDGEIYLRALVDENAFSPICIEENGDALNLIDLLHTGCYGVVDAMKGDIKRVSESFDIAKGDYFLNDNQYTL